MKKCSKCKISKELTEFNKDKRKKDMLCSSCKSCRRKYVHENKSRIKQYRFENREAIALRAKVYRAKNRERLNAYSKKWDLENKDRKIQYRDDTKEQRRVSQKNYQTVNRYRIKLINRQRYLENIEIVRQRSSEYYYKNKEIIQKKSSLYASEHKAEYCARATKRRAAKLERTPDWLTDENWDEIKEIYQDSDDLQWLSEDRLEVDHIIPLQGREVSGLHVPWNLQIITRKKNRTKGNKLIEDI